MVNSNTLCDQFASLIGGMAQIKKGVCIASRDRDIDVSILDVKTNSGVVLESSFSFEPIPETNLALNVGELVLLEHEVPLVSRILNAANIIVSAVHNHWLFDQPHIIYIHVEALMEPLEFARTIGSIFSQIEPS